MQAADKYMQGCIIFIYTLLVYDLQINRKFVIQAF